jgi:glucose/arabinose dehydrogenase
VQLKVVAQGLDSPVYVASTPSQTNRLYVVEQTGIVRVLENGKLLAAPFLDIRSRLTSGGEQGLLGLAFHPRYAQNRLFYVDYTDRAGDTRIVEYRSNGTRAPTVRRLLVFQKQPYPNHNGGQLVFGPDRQLYMGLGDGGSGGDPQNNGQSFRNLLGKIWKLNVDRPGAKPQLVAYGLRNPWRFSFDRKTGDLYIGDVGQGDWEEIDYVAWSQRGVKNFGWAAYEGNHRYNNTPVLNKAPLVFPIHEYSHSRGCSVTGGYVYRGTATPDQVGRYFFGDYCSGTVWSFRVEAGKAVELRRERIRVPSLSSFGEDARGEIYATSLNGTVYRLG